ncbi:MAG: hypothetical protein WBC91_06820 [Phototrophicaceae bacterium]
MIYQNHFYKSAFVGIIAVFFALITSTQFTQALTLDSLTITNTILASTCDASQWRISFLFTASNNDEGSGFDRYAIIATDANGVAIAADGNGTGVGISSSQTTNIGNGNSINNITASPITIVAYDTVSRVPVGANTQAIYDAVIAQGAPILGTLIYDPSTDVPACPAPVAPVVVPDGLPQPVFTDNRINNYDSAAPVAVYPHDINGETGLVVYSADGVLLLVVTPQQIADAPSNPDSNILIAQGGGVSFYRLAGGSWQINAPQYNGKTYVMIFTELFSSGGYESFEIDA